jgi:hypothetical protein
MRLSIFIICFYIFTLQCSICYSQNDTLYLMNEISYYSGYTKAYSIKVVNGVDSLSSVSFSLCGNELVSFTGKMFEVSFEVLPPTDINGDGRPEIGIKTGEEHPVMETHYIYTVDTTATLIAKFDEPTLKIAGYQLYDFDGDSFPELLFQDCSALRSFADFGWHEWGWLVFKWDGAKYRIANYRVRAELLRVQYN